MDFIDLDKVLDEFEEEEKQALSNVSDEELEPSGYLEFLEKSEEQEWASVKSKKFSSASRYILEHKSAQEAASVAYDDPYDNSFSTKKLGYIGGDQLESLAQNGHDQLLNDEKRDSKSAVVTSLTRVSVNSEGVNTVYTSHNYQELKGIANCSERKGTIAYQPIEVQTDALSPVSEQKLMSSPFPMSDIIVDGHHDAAVTDEPACFSEADQNHSPIYASMDAANIIANSSTVTRHPCATSESQTSYSESSILDGVSTSGVRFKLHSSAVKSDEPFTLSEPVVGFHDPSDGNLDDGEVSMYLNELDEGEIGDFSKPTNNSLSHADSAHVPDIQNDLSNTRYLKTRSLADELNEAEPDIDHYSLSHSESLPKKFRSDDASASFDGNSNGHNPDLVSSLRLFAQSENLPLQNGSHSALSRKNNSFHAEQTHVQTMSNSLVNRKMEVETALNGKGTALSDNTSENILPGKMEIEGLLDEVILNQNNTTENNIYTENSLQMPNLNSSRGQTEECYSKSELPEISQSAHDSNSVHSSNGCSSTAGNLMLSLGMGARPKDPSVVKKNRPNSLLGLSKVSLDLPAVVKAESPVGTEVISNIQPTTNGNAQFPDVVIQSQQFSKTRLPDIETENMARQRMNFSSSVEVNSKPVLHDFSQPFDQDYIDRGSDQLMKIEELTSDASQAAGSQKMKRPTSLNLPARPHFSMEQANEEDMEHENDSVSAGLVHPSETANGTEPGAGITRADSGGEIAITMTTQSPVIQSNIGQVAPVWIPDADAPVCMMCQSKFTMWKRRHHCRACGKVLCSVCCSQKAYLPFMENKEARVCIECHIQLNLAPGAGTNPRCPNPNNPNEYCSKVPPNQQASNHANPPVVMVPTGVLKTSGSQRRSGEPKQVMFSDGIRPGGDLTELDGAEQARAPRRSVRTARKATQQQQNMHQARKFKDDSLHRSSSLIPEEGLPPLFVLQGDSGYVETDDTLNQIDYTADYKSEEGPMIFYAVNKNLTVGVRIISLDCCVNRICWCFVTRGMNTAGQSELVVLLELTEDELSSSSLSPPRDIFLHFQIVYEEALKGNTIQDLGHSIFHQNFLGNREHGGFLFLRPSFQCLNKIPLPEPPYLFGILLQKWEVPWAKVFPIRLMLRLGAEFRYYPCPLVSVRNRKTTFFEIGHTIINLLADFRNYQYMLSQIRGVTIHMENKRTVISFPRNRYNDVMKVVRSSNEHVMALGSSFSLEADSHLVCIQNEDGNYQTQAINIQNKPRLVTGASFVVFNGALKSSSGLRAKSSIVEDGLMVQVLPEAMVSIKEAMKNMTDHIVQCGPADASEPEETVELRWVDNDRNFNIGVKSYIDETPLEGVESVSVKCPTDFLGETLALRWTRVYFLHHEDSSSSHFDPMDLSRLTEDIAQACCTALVRHLDELKNEGQVKLGLRVNLTADSVGYEIGSKGQSLPAAMINNLDTHLVPIVHQASEEGIIMELVFNLVE